MSFTTMMDEKVAPLEQHLKESLSVHTETRNTVNSLQSGFAELNNRMDNISNSFEESMRKNTAKHDAEIRDLLKKVEQMEFSPTPGQASRSQPSAHPSRTRSSNRPPGKSRRLEFDDLEDSFQNNAKDSKALRLKGFKTMFARSDLIQIATEIVTKLDLATHVSEYFAGGTASSVVIVCKSNADADLIYEASRKAENAAHLLYNDGLMTHPCKIARDESQASRQMGAALSGIFASASKHIIQTASDELKPKLSLITNKPRGLLQLRVGKNIYPLFKVISENGSFTLIKDDENRFTLPEFVTTETMQTIRAEVLKLDAFCN